MRDVLLLLVLLSQSLNVIGCQVSQSQIKGEKSQQSNTKSEPEALNTKSEPVTPIPKSESKARTWRPANYRGLIIGTSKLADMLQVFGAPSLSGPPGDQPKNAPNPEMWYEYDDGVGEFPGKLTVVVDVRSSIILRIDNSPKDLSRDEAIKHFGMDYLVTKYSFDLCLGNEESAPIYENPDGELEFVEYRERGIAINPNSLGKVNQIRYVSKPFGSPASKCK